MKSALKIVSVSGILLMLIGCSSVSRVAEIQVKAQKNGTLFGLGYEGGVYKPANDIKQICKSISNKDERCANPDKYGTLAIISRVGFADGFMGAVAVYDKQLITPGTGCNSLRTESSSNKACTFYKVEVVPGQLATVIEVASSPTKDTGNCKWESVNGWGGTVCPAYSWDWRKDGNSMVKFDLM